jgi:hypothetical protein
MGDGMRDTRLDPASLWFLLGAAVLTGLSCGSGSDIVAPTTGTLEVTSTTTGLEPDPDGYTITLDGVERVALGPSDVVSMDAIAPGDHSVGLSGVAAICAVQGDNPQTVSVTAGATTAVAFAVTCAAAAVAAVVPVTETDQTGTAGDQLPVPVTVRVTSVTGAPVGDVVVPFVIAEGGGTLSAPTVTTGPDGLAAVTWTLGTRAGTNRVTVTVGLLPVLAFRATGKAGPPHHLTVVTQPVGARAGLPLATQPVVALDDRYANRTTSGTVQVRAVLEGSGELTGGTAIAAESGQAIFSDLGLRGSAGTRSIRFEADGLVGTTSQAFLLLPPPRSDSDRPDDVSGQQFHAVYVLPADAVDRALDTGTELAYSIAAFQLWLAGKTGLRLRLDEYAGAADITFMRLQETDAQMAANDPFIVNLIEDRLRQTGRLEAGKIYLVYYEGSSTYACGGAKWPPQLPGQTAAMYLRGHPGVACPSTFASSPTAFPTYCEFAMLHDALHVLGIVSPQAPHHTAAYPGHVPEPTDLMYSGPASWDLGAGMTVDIGGDDYFGPGVPAGAANLAVTPFVESFVPAAQIVQQVPKQAEIAALRAQFAALPPHQPFEMGGMPVRR